MTSGRSGSTFSRPEVPAFTELHDSGVGWRLPAKYIENRFETISKLVGAASSPIVQEDYHRRFLCHVVMNRDNVETILTERFQHWRDFVLQHCHIASDHGIFLRAEKCSPGVESHARIDACAMVLHGKVITSDRNFVHCARLFACMPNDLRQLLDIERGAFSETRRNFGRGNMPDEV